MNNILSVKDFSYRYSGSKKSALKHISFDVKEEAFYVS